MNTSESIKSISAGRKYYVYAHLRNDTGNPFYVGKGCGGRAWVKSNRNSYWNRIVEKHGYTVKIIKTDLTEEEAYAIEIGYILMSKMSGACEANMSWGGDGVTIHEGRWWYDKVSKSLTGKPNKNKGVPAKDFATKEQLDELYTKQLLSTKQIGRMFGVGFNTVNNRLRSFNIPVRSK